ncbi:MAG: class II aldolase/adducin family protein, partial [Anaerolineales bacterium]|nr:class II aldolase/adducin family protein [Anaerolineales bacterium]
MHLEVYKRRADVCAVLHAHPIFATTLMVADLEFPVDVLPEVLLTLGEVPITEYATPASHEDAVVIQPFVMEHNAMLLRQHGSLTYGKNLDEALIHLERIEHVSEIYVRAKSLGTVKRVLPKAQLRLIELREKFFKGY